MVSLAYDKNCRTLLLFLVCLGNYKTIKSSTKAPQYHVEMKKEEMKLNGWVKRNSVEHKIFILEEKEKWQKGETDIKIKFLKIKTNKLNARTWVAGRKQSKQNPTSQTSKNFWCASDTDNLL